MEFMESRRRTELLLVLRIQMRNLRDVQLQLLHVQSELRYLNVQLIQQLLVLNNLIILQGLYHLLELILHLLNGPLQMKMKILRTLCEFLVQFQLVLNQEQQLELRLLLCGHVLVTGIMRWNLLIAVPVDRFRSGDSRCS